MTEQVKLWHCNWNWCPETFRTSDALGKHLQETHFNVILRVKKRDWDAYLRSTEGQSGATGTSSSLLSDVYTISIPRPLFRKPYGCAPVQQRHGNVHSALRAYTRERIHP